MPNPGHIPEVHGGEGDTGYMTCWFLVRSSLKAAWIKVLGTSHVCRSRWFLVPGRRLTWKWHGPCRWEVVVLAAQGRTFSIRRVSQRCCSQKWTTWRWWCGQDFLPFLVLTVSKILLLGEFFCWVSRSRWNTSCLWSSFFMRSKLFLEAMGYPLLVLTYYSASLQLFDTEEKLCLHVSLKTDQSSSRRVGESGVTTRLLSYS